jgi:hypothetical protein
MEPPAPRRVVYRERFLTSQDHLRQLLKEKDERKKKLIQTISQQKVSQSTLIKKKIKFSSYLREFRRDRLQSHI